jgi:hypothetical protein
MASGRAPNWLRESINGDCSLRRQGIYPQMNGFQAEMWGVISMQIAPFSSRFSGEFHAFVSSKTAR